VYKQIGGDTLTLTNIIAEACKAAAGQLQRPGGRARCPKGGCNALPCIAIRANKKDPFQSPWLKSIVAELERVSPSAAAAYKNKLEIEGEKALKGIAKSGASGSSQ